MPETQQLSPLAAQYKKTYDDFFGKLSPDLQARVKAEQASGASKDKEVRAFIELVAEHAELTYEKSLIKEAK